MIKGGEATLILMGVTWRLLVKPARSTTREFLPTRRRTIRKMGHVEAAGMGGFNVSLLPVRPRCHCV